MNRSPYASPDAGRAANFFDVWRDAPRLAVTKWVEAGLAVLFMLLMSQALLGPLLADATDPEAPAVLRLMWLPVYGATLILLVARPGAAWRAVAGSPLTLALVALCFISALWSLDSGLTMRRSLAIAMTTAFGLWLAVRWRWADLIRLTAITYGILAVGSFIAAVLAPDFGIMHEIHAGAWRGLWFEKNTLGAVMAYGAAASLAAAACSPRRRGLWLATTAFQVGLVFMSTSKTSLAACMLALGGVCAIALVRRGFGFASLILAGGVVATVLASLVLIVAPDAVLEAMGRDATLTGRTPIWEELLRLISERPWTGYGYGAFWAAENGPVFWVRQATEWPVPTAHNGWLEVALALGIPGVALMATIYAGAFLRAAGRFFHGPEAYWALPFLTLGLMISLTESNLLQQNGLMWGLLVATAVKLGQPREAD